MLIIATPKDKQDWLEMRMRNINSTELPALFGHSPYMTEYELWHQKKSGVVLELEDTERMLCGRLLEPIIASMFADREKVAVLHVGDNYYYDPDTRTGATPDYSIGRPLRAVFDTQDAGILEIKNVDSFIFLDGWRDPDEPPEHIQLQIQHQMHVTGCTWGYIAALVGGNCLHTYFCKYDKAIGELISGKIAAFWDSIDKDIEPQINWDRDAPFIIRQHKEVDEGTKYDGKGKDGFDVECGLYDMYRADIKKLEKSQKEMKAKIMMKMGDIEIGYSDRWNVKRGKSFQLKGVK